MLTNILGSLNYLGESTRDTDFIDHLNALVSSNVLIALSLLTSWKAFGGDPMECMVPDTFTGAWEQSGASIMLTNFLGTLHYVSTGQQDTDWIDKMHSLLSTNTLAALAILISYKQFGGKPIECMVPDMFTSAWEQYAENYCWAQDTYFLPFDEAVPKDISEREDKNISYYQWVPFFLLIEAACFRLPSLVWKYLAGHSGIKIHDIVKLALDEKNVEPECKKANVRALTIHLQNALRFHRRLFRKKIKPHRFLFFLNLPYSAIFVTTMYLLTKLLYLVNVCLQLYLMNQFLETDKYTWYGFSAFRDLINGTQWQHSGVFPRVTICDFQVRVMGNVQRYSVQCVLVINIFNEKIFIFLWFWYTILMALTALSFFYWLAVCVVPCFSRWFISRHLELSDMPFDPKGSEKDVEKFVCSYLKTDGIFVLRMITMHSGIIFGTDLVLSLWRSFYGIEEMARRTDSGEVKQITADILTPTPTGNADNKLNFLRQRWGFPSKGSGKKGSEDPKGDQSESEKELEDDNHDLSKKLIPPRTREPATAPIITGLDEPDYHSHQTLEMLPVTGIGSYSPADRRPSLSDRRGSDLHVTIPSISDSQPPRSPNQLPFVTARNGRGRIVGVSEENGLGSSASSHSSTAPTPPSAPKPEYSPVTTHPLHHSD